MKKLNHSTTISIDTDHSTFHYYSMVGNDKTTISQRVKNYVGGRFDEVFFAKFKSSLRKFALDTPSDSMRNVTVVLPDSAVFIDTVRIPTMKGSAQMKNTLDTTLGGIYKNYKDLHVVAQVVEQNKQYTTLAITAVQKYIVSSIYSACAENKLLVETLTFASSAAIGGATLLNPKLRNATYLFLDVKDIYSRFVFVVNGKPLGYYSVPFGLEFLRKTKIVQEDMLFDHSASEIAVLNAREKARSKKLTAMELGGDPVAGGYDESLVSNDENGDGADSEMQAEQRKFGKKTPRKLPKFMLREPPETKEGIACENFRVFVKWALTLIEDNERLVELGKPEFVCVNLPSELKRVIDAANEEAEENGITFTLLSNEEEESAVASNLELYGGLFPKQIMQTGSF